MWVPKTPPSMDPAVNIIIPCLYLTALSGASCRGRKKLEEAHRRKTNLQTWVGRMGWSSVRIDSGCRRDTSDIYTVGVLVFVSGSCGAICGLLSVPNVSECLIFQSLQEHWTKECSGIQVVLIFFKTYLYYVVMLCTVCRNILKWLTAYSLSKRRDSLVGCNSATCIAGSTQCRYRPDHINVL